MSTFLSWCISTHQNIDYLKLAVESIRKNAFYKDSPIIIHAENCTDGTDEWLKEQADITALIDHHDGPAKGIGGGANEAISHVKTPLFSLIHSDMYISRHYDFPMVERLMNLEMSPYDLFNGVVCSYRAEPNIWGQPSRLGTIMVPANTVDGFGTYHNDFDAVSFENWADEFVAKNVPPIEFRKVEGVSYVMRKKSWDDIGGNCVWSRPSSWDDHDLSARWQCERYEFRVTSKAMVWHFGSRGSIFMGQSDKLTGRSQRQLECEARNVKKWLEVWGEPAQYDEFGFIKVSDAMKERYKLNKPLYLEGKL